MRNLVVACAVVGALATIACKDKATPAPAKVDPRSAAIERSAIKPAIPAPIEVAKSAAVATPRIAGQVLSISPAKFTLTGKQYDVGSNGTLLQGGKPVGKISDDGKLIDSKGQLLAAMNADGEVTFPANPEMNGKAKIAEDGSLTINGESYIRVDDQGKMYSRVAKPNPLKQDGVVAFEGSDEMRRTYALMVAASIAANPSPSRAAAPMAGENAEP
jgi:roadblock/LC7 domain-containing protein